MYKIHKIFGAVIFALVLFPFSTAFAHGLYFFAWIEKDQVCTQGYYANDERAIGSRVEVRNVAGALLAEGMSDVLGQWCFVPENIEDLHLSIADNQGHRAEYKLEAASLPPKDVKQQELEQSANSASSAMDVALPELLPAQDTTDKTPNSLEQTTEIPAEEITENAGATVVRSLEDAKAGEISNITENSRVTENSKLPESANVAELQVVSAEQIRLLVREELEAQLVPLQKSFRKTQATSFKDIVGGLGWIVGLCGLASFFYVRKLGK